VSLIAFAGVVGGVFVGDYLRRNLPSDHLTEGEGYRAARRTGLLGTLSALVLGLMITSANRSYDNQTTQIRRLPSDFILLDRILEQYGPEARGSRALLRSIIDPLINTLWQKEIFEGRQAKPFEPSEVGESISAKARSLLHF
jgi:hypothetical protein